MHNFLYQLAHPWHWLTYGQNASGVASVAAVMATFAAMIAGYFAWQSYISAKGQLTAAQEQLKLAHEQFLENTIPHVIVSRLRRTHGAFFADVTNTGGGRAMYLICESPIKVVSYSLSPNCETIGAIQEPVVADPDGSTQAVLLYRSPDGREFETEVWFDPAKEEILAHYVGEKQNTESAKEERLSIWKKLKDRAEQNQRNS